ncbi:hypothetical protein [Amnibacterium endophyticum]|uniref:Uncharacterized protein n=1 Tax=Amnibacterium endophyticum TaxID=2109337 RepID=A0ABW4LH29_9MICO
MDNVIGAVIGIVLLVLSIACFPIAFALGGAWLPIFFLIGILLLSACLPLPVFLLQRFEGVGDR